MVLLSSFLSFFLFFFFWGGGAIETAKRFCWIVFREVKGFIFWRGMKLVASEGQCLRFSLMLLTENFSAVSQR